MNQYHRAALVVLVAGLGFLAAHYVAHYGNEP